MCLSYRVPSTRLEVVVVVSVVVLTEDPKVFKLVTTDEEAAADAVAVSEGAALTDGRVGCTDISGGGSDAAGTPGGGGAAWTTTDCPIAEEQITRST